MSLPNIPNITPNINVNREQVINVLLASIALEELALGHIMNAEGEKIQAVIACHPCDMGDLLKIDKSVGRVLRDVIKKEMLLQFKFEDVLELLECTEGCTAKKRCNDGY